PCAFGYGFFLLEWGPMCSFLSALVWLIILRGMLSWIRRSLVLRERIADRSDPDTRTLETNRYIFWRRTTVIAILFAIYFGAMYAFTGLGPLEALIALPALAGTLLLFVLQFGVFALANFAILFGPFVLFSRMGQETLTPRDANYEVKIEDVRGQKSAVAEMH